MDVKQFSSDKLFCHLDRVSEWLDTGVSQPVTFELDLTNLCNSKCPHCFGYFRREENKYSLSPGEAKNIIRQIKSAGGRAVTFTGGGEPLCNPFAVEAVKYARGCGLDVGFITNGSLLDGNISRELVRCCTWIRVSLDAASPGIYRVSHGQGENAFNRVLSNTWELVKIKKVNGNACTIGAGYLTFPETEKDIIPFALLGKRLGVDYVQYRPLLDDFSRNAVDYRLAAQKRILREIKKAAALSGKGYDVLYSKHKYESIEAPGELREYDKCYGHHFAAVIAADRKMYVCCHFRGVKKYCLGDLSKNSLKSVWKSKKRRAAYESINLEECPPLCRCNAFNVILWNIKQEKKHKNFI
jgi:GTP 3',8-cyclase